jgi:putative flippase GtrA
MTQVATVDKTNETEHRALNTPFDGLIKFVAGKVGGDKAIEVERFLKFAFVGVIGAMLDLGVYTFLRLTLLSGGEGGDPSRVLVIMAATFSFICAVISNFTWNRYWTYPDSRSRPIRQQLAQFALVSTIGWSARSVYLFLTVNYFRRLSVDVAASLNLGIDAAVVSQLGETVTVLSAIGVVMIWNFLVNRYWTYSDVDDVE